MRHLFLSTVAIAALAGQAFAGDLPTRKDEPAYIAPAPVFNWTGIYIGADIGGSWGNGNLWVPGAFGNFSHNASSSSVIGGGFAGYNYQINNFVLGLQGGIDGVANGNYRYTSPFGYYPNVYQSSFNQAWIASVDGRLGYTAPSWDRFLIYVIGGAAWSQQSSSLANLDLGYYVASGSKTRAGYDIGGGLEYAFTNNWTGRIEYRYYNFGSNNTLWSDGVLNGTFYRTTLTDNVVRFGLAYKYGAPNLVVSKY
jgi:outer membrane immunogenic protein